MDIQAVEKNIQYTSFRYWRIIIPIMALVIIAEYVLLFFFYPASTNTARIVSNLNLTKSVSNAVSAARNAASAARNAAANTAKLVTKVTN